MILFLLLSDDWSFKTSGGSDKCKIKGTIIHFHGALTSDIEKPHGSAIQKELCLDMVMKNILSFGINRWNDDI